jgi:hypothetical protein
MVEIIHLGMTASKSLLYRANRLEFTQIATLPGINFMRGGRHEGHLPGRKVRLAMQDVTMLLFTVVFFGLAFLYVKACKRLR